MSDPAAGTTSVMECHHERLAVSPNREPKLRTIAEAIEQLPHRADLRAWAYGERRAA